MASGDMSDGVPDNPTRAYVAEAAASGRRNVPLDVNPALASLSAWLVEARDGELVLRFTAPHTSTQGNGWSAEARSPACWTLAMAMAVLARLKPGFTCATLSLTVNMRAAGQQGHFVAVAAPTAWGGKSRSHTRRSTTPKAPALSRTPPCRWPCSPYGPDSPGAMLIARPLTEDMMNKLVMALPLWVGTGLPSFRLAIGQRWARDHMLPGRALN
jgi:acyl-coenzyme A thioesterase PaaI-like protein